MDSARVGSNVRRIKEKRKLIGKVSIHNTHHTHIQPFYSSLDFVQNNPGEPVPEETFTHSHPSWSSNIPICFLHLQRSMASSLFNPRTLQSFPQSLSMFSLVYLLAWHPPLHTPYISSSSHCLLFATCAHTIATCFAVVSTIEFMSSNPSLPLNSLLGTLSCSFTPHIHLTILISAL